MHLSPWSGATHRQVSCQGLPRAAPTDTREACRMGRVCISTGCYLCSVFSSSAEHSRFSVQSALPRTAARGRASLFSSPSCLTYPSEKRLYLSLSEIDESWLSIPPSGARPAQTKPNIPPAVMKRRRILDVSRGRVSGAPPLQPCGGRSQPQPHHLHRVTGIIPKQPCNARPRLSPALAVP